MTNKFERFFDETSTFLNDIIKTLEKPVDSEKINAIGYILVDAIEKGYDLCRQDHDAVDDVINDETYRKGVITRFDGYVVEHSSTMYVKITDPEGRVTDFDLRNIPEFKHIDDFKNSVSHALHDEDMSAFAEQNQPLYLAVKMIDQVAEKIYWRKVAKVIEQYHQNNTRDQEARDALQAAGFSVDEIENYIPAPVIID